MANTLAQQVLLDTNLEAAEDIPAYTAVVEDGNGQAAKAGDGVNPLGFTLRQFGSGERVHIVKAGIIPVIIGTSGSLSVGDSLATDSNGELDAGSSGDPVAGIVVEAPSADGDIVQVRVDTDILGNLHTI